MADRNVFRAAESTSVHPSIHLIIHHVHHPHVNGLVYYLFGVRIGVTDNTWLIIMFSEQHSQLAAAVTGEGALSGLWLSGLFLRVSQILPVHSTPAGLTAAPLANNAKLSLSGTLFHPSFIHLSSAFHPILSLSICFIWTVIVIPCKRREVLCTPKLHK